eukprot:261232-Prymnesium_polylepis.1
MTCLASTARSAISAIASSAQPKVTGSSTRRCCSAASSFGAIDRGTPATDATALSSGTRKSSHVCAKWTSVRRTEPLTLAAAIALVGGAPLLVSIHTYRPFPVTYSHLSPG